MGDFRLIPFLIALALIVVALLVEAGGTGIGLGIGALLIFDALVLLTVLLIGAPLIIGHERTGRLQGIVTLVWGVLVLLAALVALFLALTLIGVMLTALGFVLPYLAVFADFRTGDAAVVLALSQLLKLGAALALVIAHPKFLENRGLVVIIVMSLALGILLGILHAFPGIIVSITDAVGAVIIAIIALIRAAGFAIGGLLSLRKAVV